MDVLFDFSKRFFFHQKHAWLVSSQDRSLPKIHSPGYGWIYCQQGESDTLTLARMLRFTWYSFSIFTFLDDQP